MGGGGRVELQASAAVYGEGVVGVIAIWGGGRVGVG